MGELTITTAEPAFVTNHLNRIVSVNRAAADLLGFDGMDTTGMPCWRLLGGTDVAGNQFCRPNCPLLRAALAGETLLRFPVRFQFGGGKNVTVTVSAVALYLVAAPHQPAIVHLLAKRRCRVGAADTSAVLDARVATGPPPVTAASCMLTRRELELLRLMAEGFRSDQIARRLFISVLTVRTHIQRILAKLEAHSKLEAVALARRLNLL